MKIFIHTEREEVNFNDNISIIDQVEEENVSYQPIHTDDKSETNNVTLKEG